MSRERTWKHMAEVNASDNSFFFFFLNHSVSFLQRQHENGYGWNFKSLALSSTEEVKLSQSSKIHLAICSPPTHTHIHTYIHTDGVTHTHIQKNIPTDIGSVFKVNFQVRLLLLFYLIKSQPQHDMQDPLSHTEEHWEGVEDKGMSLHFSKIND